MKQKIAEPFLRLTFRKLPENVRGVISFESIVKRGKIFVVGGKEDGENIGKSEVKATTTTRKSCFRSFQCQLFFVRVNPIERNLVLQKT